MEPAIVVGDLLDQEVDVIVNAWNRNIIPWWLLLPQGISGAIKRRGGVAPFREVGRAGPMALGSAVLTGAGRLRYRGIIHVAGINMLWRASEHSVRDCVVSAMEIVEQQRFRSVGFPIIGAGSGGLGEERALAVMVEALRRIGSESRAVIVRYRRGG